jgi:hypothetical protein
MRNRSILILWMFHDNVEGKVDTTTTVANLKFSYGDYRLPG